MRLSEILADMLARADRDEDLINRIMRVKDILLASAAITDEVFYGENPASNVGSRSRMVLTVYDLIEEDPSSVKELNMAMLDGAMILDEDDENGTIQT